MQAKFENLLNKKNGPKFRTTVLVSTAGMLFSSIVLFKATTITPRSIIAYLMMLWFLWLFLKARQFVECLKLIDKCILDELEDRKTQNSIIYKCWDLFESEYKNKRKKSKIFEIFILLILFMINSYLSKSQALLEFTIFYAFVVIVVRLAQRIAVSSDFLTSIYNYYSGDSINEILGVDDVSSWENYLLGTLGGLILIIALYIFVEMPLHTYFLLFILLSSLIVLTNNIIAYNKKFLKSIKYIDSIRFSKGQ